MKIVTSGANYLDIDAYACAVAYVELLKLQGEDAIAFSTAPLNESISTTVRSWNAPLTNDYSPSDDDTFIPPSENPGLSSPGMNDTTSTERALALA